MIKYLCVFVLVAVFNSSYSQGSIVSRLNSGDMLPDVPMLLHIGDSSFVTHLTDLKGRLIIFDFWDITCGACVASMPKMSELQDEFGDRIKVIMVTRDKESDIKKFWVTLKDLVPQTVINAGLKLSFVTEDSSFEKMFPHFGIPAHVWVDQKGVFRFLSYDFTTTSASIGSFLDGRKTKLAMIIPRFFDINNPFSWQYNNTEPVLSHSLLMRRIEFGRGQGYASGEIVDSLSKRVVGINEANAGFIELFRMAFSHQMKVIADNRIILNVKDKSRFYPPEDPSSWLEWADSNTFCFSIKVPPDQSELLYSFMKQDLYRYFHYSASIEIRKVRCLVLKKALPSAIRQTNRDDKDVLSKGGYILHNEEFFSLYAVLAGFCESRYKSCPFLIDDFRKKNIRNVDLPWNLNLHLVSINSLRRALLQNGLDLVFEYRDLSMLVIKDY